MSATLLVALVLAMPAIASSSNCPSAHAIERNLAALLPAQGLRPGTVAVDVLPDMLIVDLLPEGAARVEQRLVRVAGDCGQRATVASVLIATWWPSEDRERPEVEIRVPVVRSERRSRLALSAGVFASAIWDSVAPGARAELSFGQRGLGIRLSLSGTAPQGRSLGHGTVEWWRLSVELGPTYRVGPVRLDVGSIESMLAIQGSNFPVYRSSTGATAGVTAGLRVSRAFGAWLPWLELRGIGWPLSQRVYTVDEANQPVATRALPTGELQLGVGGALSLP